MAGAQKIVEKIIDDANAKAKQTLEEASKEASTIMAQAKEDCENKSNEILSKADTDSTETIKRMISVAELEGRKMRLNAKQEMVDESFKKALEAISKLPEQEYEKLIEKLLLKSVETGDEEVIFSSKDKERLGSNFIATVNSKLQKNGLAGKLVLADDTVDIIGGFILRKGRIENNNSFETILKFKRDEIETDVVNILFG